MTIEEAIMNMTSLLHSDRPIPAADCRTTLKLSLEALKRIESQRRPEGVVTPTVLPGETA